MLDCGPQWIFGRGPLFPPTRHGKTRMGNCCFGESNNSNDTGGHRLVQNAEPTQTPEMVDREQLRKATEERLRVLVD